MNIGSGNGWPSSALSNFAPHPFVFDGVECASMEGLLQSFKFDKTHIQVEVCKLVGLAAKRRGQKRNNHWRERQELYWGDFAYDRHGIGYQKLLDRAFDALANNDGFKRALMATRGMTLTHTIGSNDPSLTVLTRREFCGRLEKIRERLWAAG